MELLDARTPVPDSLLHVLELGAVLGRGGDERRPRIACAE
jgi:hypothetical protein